MAYQSGEFSAPGLSGLGAPPGVGIYGNSLVVIGGTNPGMVQTIFDLTSLSSNQPTNGEPIDTEALTNLKNWTPGNMNLTDTQGFTYGRCAAITMPDALYGFWHHFLGGSFGGMDGSSSDLRAGKFSGTWGSSIKLLESDGKTAPVPLLQQSGFPSYDLQAYADVSATAFGDNLIIFACAQATSATNTTGGIYLAIYDTTKIDSDLNTWTADWHTYLSAAQMQVTLGPSNLFSNTGVNISIDWFSLVPTNKGNLAYFLAISFAAQNSNSLNGEMMYLPLNVSANSSGGVNLSIDTSALEVGIMLNVVVSPKSFLATPILRDPAGRLRVYNIAGNPWAGSFMTTQMPGPNYDSPGLPWSTEIDQFKTQQSGFNPAVGSFFYIFPQAQSTTFDNLPATEYAVYEFIFYDQCQVNRYGTIEMIPNYGTPIPTQNASGTPPPSLDDTVNIIAGITDGPIPLPIVNYIGVDLGQSQIDQGDVTYGTSSTTTTSRQLSTSWTVGLETSGEVTDGVGAAWNLSANFGMGSVLGNTQASSTSYSLSTPAIVNFETASPSLSPFGTLRVVSAQINATAFRFLDANGNLVSDATSDDPGQASKLSAMVTTFFQPNQLSYLPYSVTPGDLTTYTPEAWNTKMKSLGYTGDNYYGDIICTNAYPFGNSAQPYVACSWSEGSKGSSAVGQFTSAYTEQSWTLDASIFLGVSAGGGFDIFGLGEEAQVSMLAGTTATHTTTTQENTESGWTINLSEEWGPTLGTDPNAVTKYDFRIFFLPVPTQPSTLPANYWTNELRSYMPTGTYPAAKNIDPNSSCWRMVFVVTAIEYGPDATLTPYQYDFSLDKRSVYPDGDPIAAKT